MLHISERAALDQSLSRLAKRGELLRIDRGSYLLLVQTEFGRHAPSIKSVLASLAESSGEVIVENGASAANQLGLSTQNPVRLVFWTSDRTRVLSFAKLSVELRHVSNKVLLAPQTRAELAFRALIWLGASEAEIAIEKIKSELKDEELQSLLALRKSAPGWLAKEMSTLVYTG